MNATKLAIPWTIDRKAMSAPGPDLAALLASLADRAELSSDDAVALPPHAYTDPTLLTLEEDRIFAAEWQCAGRADEIPSAGDFLTYSIGPQPVFCIRTPDGSIRSFANVCRHRMMRLLEGRGQARRIACPYHGWTYDLTGKLVSAPHMNGRRPFAKDKFCLPEIRTEIWDGWIYITLNPKIAPVADRLASLAAVTDRYGAASYRTVISEDYVWRTNWKLLTENFMESYHLPIAHRATVGAWCPIEDTTFAQDRNDAFTYQIFYKEDDAVYGRAHPKNDRLEGEWRGRSIMPTVFPAHMFVLAPDHLWYLTLRPDGVGRTRVRFGVAVPPEVLADHEADRDRFIADLKRFFDQVNDEDKAVVEAVYENAHAPLSDPGPLSWMERELHDFHMFLARSLTGTAPTGSH